MTTSDIKNLIIQSAQSKGLDPNFALAVATHESSLNPNAVGPVNKNGTRDYGLFQINDSNLSEYGITQPLDPTQNIDAGTTLLKQLVDVYGGDKTKALIAYNAGPGNEAKGFQDTAYVNAVMGIYNSLGGGQSTYTDASALPVDTSSEDMTQQTDASVTGGDGTLIAVFAAVGFVAWMLFGRR